MTENTHVTRRSVLRSGGVGGSVLITGCSGVIDDLRSDETPTETPTQTPRNAPAESWPMFAHDPRNSGHNQSTFGPTDAIEPRWEFDTGAAVRSSPAVVRGTVYIGSDDGNVYAIDATTGEEEWAFQTGGAVVSSPAVLRNVVYVGSDDRHVYALHAERGELLWDFETGERVRSSPTVASDIHERGVDEVVGFGSDDGSIYYVAPKSGDSLRTIPTDGPVVASPMMYVTSGGLWEAGTGSTDGTSYWWIPGGRLGKVNALPADAPVYASISSPETSTENIWYRAHDDGTLSKRIFEGSNRAVWTFEAEEAIRTTPVLADDAVYVGSRDGNVYGIDAESGDQTWAFETDGRVDSSPAVVDGVLYVGSADQHVYALDTATGESLWVFETDDEVHSSPAVVAGTVYIGSNDGSIYALADPSS